MKRIAVIAWLILVCSFPSAGQSVFVHLGVEGGMSANRFTDLKDIEKGLAGWHAGMSLLAKLPGFFALQPTVEFERSCTSLALPGSGERSMNIDAINVPVSVQWGPDLGICRVFAEAVPFFGFNLNGGFKGDNGWESVRNYLKTSQFGVGVGAGLDIWRVQLNVRYNWAFGKWENISSGNPFGNLSGNKKGFALTLAIFFN